MKYLFFSLCALGVVSSSFSSNTELSRGRSLSDVIFGFVNSLFPPLPEDATLLVPQLLIKYGYPCEIYYVTTSDGYILQLHRVPYGRAGPTIPDRPVVYIQHGFLMSSADYVFTGTTRGLAYLLADRGYDVWLGNARGNRYSRNHTTINPDNPQFWDFTWHEIGKIDVPTMINFVKNFTNKKDLLYIGHSQGTSTFFVMCSERPEMCSSARAMFALAPIAFISQLQSLLVRVIAWTYPLIRLILNTLGIYELLPRTELMANIGNTICAARSILQPACVTIVDLVVGFDTQQVNGSVFQLMLAHTPAGSSVGQGYHFLQGINTGRFAEYDYGDPERNLAHYGSRVTRDYNLTSVTAPVLLYKGGNDWLDNLDDVQKLVDALPNLQGNYLNPYPYFNHLDFIHANDTVGLMYNRLFSDMERYPEQ